MAKTYAVFVVLLLCDLSSAARKPKNNVLGSTGSTSRPNIVFILADDLDRELGSPDVMTKTQKILQREGADFVNAFVTTPMCCPSRASILTGSYAHNHHTFTNNLNCSSPAWRKGPERKSYARYLELSGYVTGYFGKYLNEYDGSWVPVGWNRWEGLLHNSKFYNYTLRHNTYKERHKMSYEEDYFTDLITNRSISFIRRTKQAKPDSPFLAVLSHSAPHGPETAAPQYSNAFPNARAPRYDNWNFISMDKQWILRRTPPMDAQKIEFVDLLHRRRLQTLLSVDDSIERIFRTLQSLGIENETYIFFTSDHGYHLGQFGLVKGKSMPFESDIRVPFYVRGPIIPKNIRMKDMVLNIDLAPTFLDIAGVKIPKDMDGVSIMKLFRKTKHGRRAKRRTHVAWRDTILIERSRGWRRTKNMLEGRSRNKTITPKDSKLTVLERICSKTKYQSPCQINQLWECVTLDRRPRLRKCRRNATAPTTRTTQSTATIAPVKMCVCMTARPGSEVNVNQGDMLPYEDELIVSGMDYLTTELRRRSERSPYSTFSTRKKASEFNARRYEKELARALRLQNRRSKSKALIRTPDSNSKPESNSSVDFIYGTSGVQAVEERLGKLKEKIQGMKLRLGALRDLRKKLRQISSRDRLIEYPCPCDHGNSTLLKKVITENPGNDPSDQGQGHEREEQHDNESQTSPLRRRSKQIKATSRKAETKKKKAKPRRTKCASPGVNCFYQTNDHWRLPPLWTGGEFCFCPNAANNSYWCLRTINATHNFLYCEFITHFYQYFDLNKDPYQLYNKIDEVSPVVLSQLHQQLSKMKDCKGEHCTHYHGKKYPTTSLSTSQKSHTREPFNKTKGSLAVIRSPTLPSHVETSSKSSAKPLTSERPYRSEVVVNTSNVAMHTSKMTESAEGVPFTTSVPTQAKVRTLEHSTIQSTVAKRRKVLTSVENRQRESSPLPTQNINRTVVSNEMSVSHKNFSRPSGASKKSNLEEINVEKPSQHTVAAVLSSGNVPTTVISKSSEADTSFLEKNGSSILPTSASSSLPSKEYTSGMNLTLKPTREKSPKRRKNGQRVDRRREKNSRLDKQKQKVLKKSKKSKKKSVKEGSPLPKENTIKLEVSKSPDRTSKSRKNISNLFSENVKNAGSDKEQMTVEKPSEAVTGSQDLPTTDLVKPSEPDARSSERQDSSALPTSSSTTLTLEENTSKLKNSGNKKHNKLLPGISRKRSKKLSSKRPANRNSKKRSQQRPPKRQRPSQVSEGEVEKGAGVQEEPFPSEP